jgi:hypothetical protein
MKYVSNKIRDLDIDSWKDGKITQEEEEEEEIDKIQVLSFNLQFCYLRTDRYHRVSILKSLQAKPATFLQQQQKKGKKGFRQQKRGGRKE